MEGKQHPDRDAQFRYINDQVTAFQADGSPVISVDAKKKENVGNFKNGGAEWAPAGQSERVSVHDFADEELGKAVPYGSCDLTANTGWVNVGTDHDTGAFAVASIRSWWNGPGQAAYPHARRLLITADSGGADGSRLRLWKTTKWPLPNAYIRDNCIGVSTGATGSGSHALYADGDATVTGNLSKGGGGFRIDHPVDPANKYLYHSFVESPDMMNVYSGNVILGSEGKATVELPDWFEALNRDFRYQLTSIGSLDPTCISRKVSDGSFEIMGSPQQEVSWQVTGIRQDAWANAHRVPVEVEKKPADRGRYLHPELFGGEPIEEIARGRRNRERLPDRVSPPSVPSRGGPRAGKSVTLSLLVAAAALAH